MFCYKIFGISAVRGTLLLMLFFFSNLFTINVAFSEEEVLIERVNYASKEEVHSVWIPRENSQPVSLGTEDERKILKFELNFPEVEKRYYWDRSINLDLSQQDKIVLELKADDPSELGNCTLYFQSKGGWYYRSFTIEKRGWQKIVLRKSQFSLEGNPEGWNNITGIRISFWKPAKIEPKRTTVYLTSIRALSSTSGISIVLGDATIKKGSGEAGTVRRCFEGMVSIFEGFEGLGLDYSTTSDSEIEKGIDLKKCKILVFPYSPDITDKEAEEIVKFINSGGKVLIFYTIPSNIAKAIGIKEYVYRRASSAGEFSSVRFSREAVDGLPEQMRQESGNANIPTNLSEDAKIIGEWIDAKGNPTGLPAAIISPRGFHFGHILLNEEEGKQMILAILANLSPDLSPLIRKALIATAGKIYGFENFVEAKKYIEKKTKGLEKKKTRDILMFLGTAEKELNKLQKSSNLSEIFNLWKAVTSNMKEA